jgi:hypothetical protein
MVLQAPVPDAQDVQAPEQLEAEQQNPSLQVPLRHWAPEVQALPARRTHAPLPLQVLAPAHVSGSSAFVTGTQAPVALHVLQMPLHALEQHSSSQEPDAHWLPTVHVWPAFRRHTPPALHVSVPVHVSASSAPVTETHAPLVSHVLQVPPQAALQHFSSHTPLTQDVAPEHG